MLIPKLKYIFRCACNGKYNNRDIKRFISKIDTTYGLGPWGNCWEINGKPNYSGYGTFSYKNGGKCRTHRAHRASFIINNQTWIEKDVA